MEQQTVSLKLCISELTHRQIAKDGSDFVYLDDKTKVSKKVLDEAILLQSSKELEIKKAEAKVEKEHKLATLTVTTSNGNTFDGNLEARTNMTSTILSADVIGKTEEYWKLADNTTKLIQLTELREALALAIQEVGNIVKDY